MSDPTTGVDHFAAFGEVRRPWLNADRLKEQFLEQSAQVHPDRVHGADERTRAEAGRRYAELNASYQVLKEARSRILHLMELESGAKPKDIQRIPPGTMDLFVEVGQMCRSVDEFLAERGNVSSPMLKVRLFRQGMEWVEKIRSLQAKVAAREAELDAELKGLNSVWESAPAEGSAGRPAALPLTRLEEIYRVLSYSGRWMAQMQERMVSLASV